MTWKKKRIKPTILDFSVKFRWYRSLCSCKLIRFIFPLCVHSLKYNDFLILRCLSVTLKCRVLDACLGKGKFQILKLNANIQHISLVTEIKFRVMFLKLSFARVELSVRVGFFSSQISNEKSCENIKCDSEIFFFILFIKNLGTFNEKFFFL